jgi:hypothetical protein
VVNELASGHGPIDKVAGIEARGFILAAPAGGRLCAGPQGREAAREDLHAGLRA